MGDLIPRNGSLFIQRHRRRAGVQQRSVTEDPEHTIGAELVRELSLKGWDKPLDPWGLRLRAEFTSPAHVPYLSVVHPKNRLRKRDSRYRRDGDLTVFSYLDHSEVNCRGSGNPGAGWDVLRAHFPIRIPELCPSGAACIMRFQGRNIIICQSQNFPFRRVKPPSREIGHYPASVL